MLFKGMGIKMLICLNRLSDILSKCKPLRCLLNIGLTKMVPANRVKGLSVNLGKVPFKDTKINRLIIRTGNPKISIKIRINVRMHISPALNSTKKNEIYSSGMVTMYKSQCPRSKEQQSNQLEFLNHLIKHIFIYLRRFKKFRFIKINEWGIFL